jgi:hypothetical protein
VIEQRRRWRGEKLPEWANAAMEEVASGRMGTIGNGRRKKRSSKVGPFFFHDFFTHLAQT